MVVGEEWISSSYATTTVGIDVANCLFDEDGFWAPTQEIIKVNFLQFNIVLLFIILLFNDLVLTHFFYIICRLVSPLYLSYELLMARSPL